MSEYDDGYGDDDRDDEGNEVDLDAMVVRGPQLPPHLVAEGQAAAYRNALGYFVHGPYCVPTDKAGDALMHLVNEHSERGEWEAADRLLASGFRLSVGCDQAEAVRVTSFVVSMLPGGAYAGYDADAGRLVFWRRSEED